MWTGCCDTPSVFKVLTNIFLETLAVIKSHIIGTFVNLLTSVGYKIFVNCPWNLWLLCLLASNSSVWRLSHIATCLSALWIRNETRLEVCHRGSPGSISGHSFGICGGKNDSGTGLCPSTSAFLCQFDSIKGPYFMCRLPLTLYTWEINSVVK
jgi:hypothetical protein